MRGTIKTVQKGNGTSNFVIIVEEGSYDSTVISVEGYVSRVNNADLITSERIPTSVSERLNNNLDAYLGKSAPPSKGLYGGKRSSLNVPQYMKLTSDFLVRVARTREYGDLKYGPDNWKQFSPEMRKDCFNHAIEHLFRAFDNDASEDHFAHAVCNIMFLMYFEDEELRDTRIDAEIENLNNEKGKLNAKNDDVL